MKLLFLSITFLLVIYHAFGIEVKQGPIAIIKFVNDGVHLDGSYKWAYETANEIFAEEEGHIKKLENSDEEIAEVSGKFGYTAPDGSRIETSYIANENGFQPQGAHLPTTPEVPRAVQKLIEFARSQPQRSESTNSESQNNQNRETTATPQTAASEQKFVYRVNPKFYRIR